MFVKATLENPSFSSQTKTECTSKVSSFGSRFDADEEFMKKVHKLGIMDDALALAKHKEPIGRRFQDVRYATGIPHTMRKADMYFNVR